MKVTENIGCHLDLEFAEQIKVLAGGNRQRSGFIRRMVEVGLAQTYGSDWSQKANELVRIDRELEQRRQALLGVASISSHKKSEQAA